MCWMERRTGIEGSSQTIYIYILKSNPSRQDTKVLYHWGVRRRAKTGNHGKIGVKRKWWVSAKTGNHGKIRVKRKWWVSNKETGGSHPGWNH